MGWRAQLVSDDVLATLVPAEFGEPSLECGARRRALLHLDLAEQGERGDQLVIKAAPLARRQRPWLSLGGSPGRTPGHSLRARLIKETRSASGRVSVDPSSSLPIVQLATTASRSPFGRRTRSASPNLDTAATHQDLGACEEDGTEQLTAPGFRCQPDWLAVDQLLRMNSVTTLA